MLGLAEMGLEEVGGEIAHAFIGVALFGECDAFGGEPFEFDRADFGAVLISLRAFLGLFIVVECAVDPGGHAVEDICRGRL